MLEEGRNMPRKFRKAIVYMMIIVMFLGTVLMGISL
ncbi:MULTISPECIES: stressosome-associated protein Prli42 [Salipaludibacillus]